MEFDIKYTDDPEVLLNETKEYLNSDPLRNNLILTILDSTLKIQNNARYWYVKNNTNVVGVFVQPSIDSRGIISTIPTEAVRFLADTLSDGGIVLPGIVGEVSTVAVFAGEWADKNKTSAHPFLALRLYELQHLHNLKNTNGNIRAATIEDSELLNRWLYDLAVERGEYQETTDSEILHARKTHISENIEMNIEEKNLWVWVNPEPVSMAFQTPILSGVIRVEKVYTPPEHRQNGYATACVGKISQQIYDEGYHCILYSDLENPVSNSIYRRIGYNPIAEIIQYRFN
ncbi:hypothetical protein JT359_05925 [Candidatus Poribacteria bacterium]|nr:hypothetical protein [Candidatus Poribacteria bacterium]